MERHFLLPVSIAAMLHAGLFFGVTRGPLPELPARNQSAVASPRPVPETVDITPLPPPDRNDEVMPTSSGPRDPMPHSVEPPPSPDPKGFHVDIPRTDPRTSLGSLTRIEPWVPGGAGEGPINGIPSVLSAKALDNPPNARVQIAPDYPFEARKNGISGEVTMEFLVDEAGRVVEPRVVRSSDRVFEESTLRAVAKWRFEPGKREGRIVRFRMVVPVVFNVNDAG